MQPRPGRALGNPEDEAGLGRRQPDMEVQDEDRALLDVEAPEAALDLIAISEVARRIADGRRGRVERVTEEPASTVSIGLPVARSDDEAMDPRFPGVGITQGTHVSPGGDERILNRILGAVRIPKDEGRDPVQASGRCLGQRGEGGVITLLGPLDECSIHPRHPCGAADVATLTH